MLRAESRGEADVGNRMQRIQRMRQVGGDRRRMREQGDAAAGQRTAQFGFGKQAVDAELERGVHERFRGRVKLSRQWKSGFGAWWASAQ